MLKVGIRARWSRVDPYGVGVPTPVSVLGQDDRLLALSTMPLRARLTFQGTLYLVERRLRNITPIFWRMPMVPR